MILINEELKYKLKIYGYSILIDETQLVIRNNNSSTYFIRILLVIGGFILIPFAGTEPEIVALSILLIIYPIATIRTNSHDELVFRDNFLIINSYSFLFPTKRKLHLNNFNLELSEYEQDSYTTPFEEGCKEYSIEMFLKFKQGYKVELFHFTSRKKSHLTFAVDLGEQIKSWVNGYST